MKEKTCLILRSNIISDYLKGMKVRHIIRKYQCSPSTACKWIKYYREIKKQQDENEQQNKSNEKSQNNYDDTIEKETNRDDIDIIESKKKDKKLNEEGIKDKYILNELDKMDLSRRKAKRNPTSISKRIQDYLYKQFSNKRTGGKDNRSIMKVMAKANKIFNLENGKNEIGEKRLTYGTVQRFLKMKFGKARRLIKRPLLKPHHLEQRKNFADYIINSGIKHRNIFFTDEKRFVMNFVPNKQTNQIRLTKEFQQKLKEDNPEVKKLLTVEVEKHPKGVMVAGGVSYYGVGKLNFIIGAMDSVAYAQTLEFYKQDIQRFKELGVNLIFQQDNSPCHCSADITKKLSKMKKLDFWPPNSPDLSPIECVWAQVQKKLEGYTFNSLEEMKKKIIYEWNRVPAEYCKKICDKFIRDIQQIHEYGRIKEKQHTKKDNNKDGGKKENENIEKNNTYEDKIENVAYNKGNIENIIKFHIKSIEKRNKSLSRVIHKLRLNRFKKQVKDEILNTTDFEYIYQQFIEENIKIYKKNKREIRKLSKIKAKDYFNQLTFRQKVKYASLAPKYGEDKGNKFKKRKKIQKKKIKFKKLIRKKFIKLKKRSNNIDQKN